MKYKAYKANYTLKDIKMLGGSHKIRFDHDPVYCKVSLLIYNITFGVYLVCLAGMPFLVKKGNIF